MLSSGPKLFPSFSNFSSDTVGTSASLSTLDKFVNKLLSAQKIVWISSMASCYLKWVSLRRLRSSASFFSSLRASWSLRPILRISAVSLSCFMSLARLHFSAWTFSACCLTVDSHLTISCRYCFLALSCLLMQRSDILRSLAVSYLSSLAWLTLWRCWTSASFSGRPS